jgi:hypothetical protein
LSPHPEPAKLPDGVIFFCHLSAKRSLPKQPSRSNGLAQSNLSIAMARGERIDPECHHTRADVKAVTLHHFSLQKNPSGWQARGIQDI